MTNEATARDLAAKALIFIAQDPDRIGRFLALSGTGPADIREQAEDPMFLGGILDHLLMDEALLVDFANWVEIAPSAVAEQRLHLPGAMPI